MHVSNNIFFPSFHFVLVIRLWWFVVQYLVQIETESAQSREKIEYSYIYWSHFHNTLETPPSFLGSEAYYHSRLHPFKTELISTNYRWKLCTSYMLHDIGNKY